MSTMSRAQIERETLEWAEERNPESDYWKRLAMNAAFDIAEKIGVEAHREWAEATWPGDSIDALTWKQIWEVNHKKLDELKKEAEND